MEEALLSAVSFQYLDAPTVAFLNRALAAVPNLWLIAARRNDVIDSSADDGMDGSYGDGGNNPPMSARVAAAMQSSEEGFLDTSSALCGQLGVLELPLGGLSQKHCEMLFAEILGVFCALSLGRRGDGSGFVQACC